MIRSRLTAALTTVILLVVAAPASAQLDARNQPRTRGPLTTRDRFHDCQTRIERFEGEIAGRFRVCYWYFLYDPAHESSARKNYAGFWAQGTVTPVGEWCARRARFDLDLPAARHVHARAPRAGTVIRTSSSRRYTTRLKLDAQGQGDQDGFIANTFRVFANRMTVLQTDRGRTHRMAWSGGTGRTVAFASGVELSYRPGRQLPSVNPKLFAFLVRSGTC